MLNIAIRTLFLCLWFVFYQIGCGSVVVAVSSSGYDNYAALTIDANQKTVLFAHYPTKRISPGSLTKLMSLYLIFEAIENEKISPTDVITFSPLSFDLEDNRKILNLKVGQSYSIKELLLAVMVASADDALMLLVEEVASEVRDFVDMMNKKASAIGMNETKFSHPLNTNLIKSHYSTPQDMMLLILTLRNNFPQYYKLFNISGFVKDGRIYDSYHSSISHSLKGVDAFHGGLDAVAGYNLFTSLVFDENEILGVVFGLTSHNDADKYMVKMLDYSLKRLLSRGNKRFTYEDYLTSKNTLLLGQGYCSTTKLQDFYFRLSMPALMFLWHQITSNTYVATVNPDIGFSQLLFKGYPYPKLSIKYAEEMK